MHKTFWFVKLEKERKLGKTIYSYKNNIKTYLKVKTGILCSEQGSVENRFKHGNKHVDLIKREKRDEQIRHY